MNMVPGLSLKFKYTKLFQNTVVVEARSGFDYIEATEEMCARSRYYGQMSWVDKDDIGAVAIFFDTVTGDFYGQSA